MLNIAFEEQTTEIKQVFQVQKKCDLCWRCQVHRVSTSEKNRLKCVSSDGTSTQKQSVSMKLLTCWEFCLCQFTVFGQSEHALDCCEICAPSAEWRAEAISQDHYKSLEKYPEYLSLITMGAEMLVCGYSAETLEFWYYHNLSKIMGCTCNVSNDALLEMCQTVVQIWDCCIMSQGEYIEQDSIG